MDYVNATFENGTGKFALSAPHHPNHRRRSRREQKKFYFSASIILGLAGVAFATAASAEDMFTKAPVEHLKQR